MANRIVFVGAWGYFEGRIYSDADIRMLADMRRKGLRDGKLEGQALEDFVIACLRTPGYQVLGLPMTPADYLLVETLQSLPAPCF